MELEKLLEKKDVRIYIAERIIHLQKQKRIAIKKAKPKDRAMISERFRGKILELAYFNKHIDILKKTAKRYWKMNRFGVEQKHEIKDISRTRK